MSYLNMRVTGKVIFTQINTDECNTQLIINTNALFVPKIIHVKGLTPTLAILVFCCFGLG